jgi:signal transduction histidine kinase
MIESLSNVPEPVARRCQVIAHVIGWGVFALGLSVLAGWSFDLSILKSVVPGAPATKCDTAVCLMFGGLALSLDRPDSSRALANVRTEVDVNMDSDRIRQVVANLLSNAAKFSPPGGTVSVGATPNGDMVRVSIGDHGPGIPDAFRDKIFQKFSQADSSNTRQESGTGLGLSIAKTIVDLHGGSIGFFSLAGAGTTFHFDLPVVRENALI